MELYFKYLFSLQMINFYLLYCHFLFGITKVHQQKVENNSYTKLFYQNLRIKKPCFSIGTHHCILQLKRKGKSIKEFKHIPKPCHY